MSPWNGKPSVSTGYEMVHKRVRAQGAARDRQCSAPDCSKQADVWAWQRTGPSRDGVHSGKQVTWGTDPSTYAPMCLSHASRLDHGGTLTHCPRGHERARFGEAFNQCAECHRLSGLRSTRQTAGSGTLLPGLSPIQEAVR